ncbi:MAG: sodium-dependent bicarbonate transport family permease [Planktomarina sp.]
MLGSAASNLLDPAVLFFVLGAGIGLLRSNLEIPGAIAKFMTLYLLMALGLKGGAALASGGLPAEGILAIVAAVIMAAVVPAYSFFILSRRIDPFDSAAVAATYGSISAVTFITTQGFLVEKGVEFGGYMTVAMVLMETPAIIMAVVLATAVRARQAALEAAKGNDDDDEDFEPLSIKEVLQEALTDGAQLLLIGSLIIGYLAGEDKMAAVAPFTNDIFKGMLAFFLLEMGLLVGKQISEGRAKIDKELFLFAFLSPPINAAIALAFAYVLGLQLGDAMLLAILTSSASYIVVPAVARYAIPEARPGIYFTMALGLTFPFNILVGIPLYFGVAQYFWS